MKRPSRAFAAIAAGTSALSLSIVLPPTAQADPAPNQGAQLVTLVTGERVLVREVNGKPVATAESGGSYATQLLGGDLYVIPATALPYLGNTLDRSLFDVSALIRDGLTGDAKIPVHVSYVDKPVAVPGVEAGVVTDAKAFGDALAKPLAGVSSIKLAAAGAPQQAVPHFPMHTVKIHAIGLDGRPATTSLGVVNTDDARKYLAFPGAIGGEARISAPDGNYGIVTIFPELTNGRLAALRAVTTDFTVAGADTETTIDIRTATSPVSLSTPLPATATEGSIGFARGDGTADGNLGDGFFFGGDLPVFVSPVTTAPHGSLHFNIGSHRESPAGTANPYTYDVKADNAGTIPADQHHQVEAGQLTRLQEHFLSDTPGRKEAEARILFLPYEVFGFGFFHPLTAPLTRTEYVGAGKVSATDALIGYFPTFSGFAFDGERAYQPGTTRSVDWLRGPLAPGWSSPVDPKQRWLCNACRMDDTLDLYLAPLLDSDGHEMALDARSPGAAVDTHYRLTTGDTVLADGKLITGAEVTAPPQRADYRLTYDQTRTAPWFHQSTASHTEWTFSSRHSGQRTVPDTFLCGQDGTAPDCSALSLVTANYRLDTAQDGTIAGREGHAVITFGHTPGAWNLPVFGATFEVSFDGGKTWQRACVEPAGYNRFRASWDNPAAATATDVAVRISARDVAGASITQSVTAAYTVPPQS